MKRGIVGLVIAVLLVLLDQLTKFWAVLYLKGQEPLILFENVFELRYLENRGAAFGILQGKKTYFVIFTFFALAAIVWFYLKRIPNEKRYGFLNMICILLFAGAVGNLIDRIRLDYVVDFFYFKWIDFPIFNVADIYVTVAAAAMIVLGLFYYKDEDFEVIFPSDKKKGKKNYAD